MTDLEKNITTYFGDLSETELRQISSFFQPVSLVKGEYFCKTGQPCLYLSFIKSGMLRIYIDTGDREVTQWISTPGYFVTDLSSLIFHTPARWTIRALADTQLYSLSAADYHKLGAVIPKWHELEKLFIANCFAMLEDRIFSHLSMTAEERYHFFYEKNKALFTQVPLHYIASMLGMTPETFSRIRKKSLF